MNQRQSILKNIYDAVNKIPFKTQFIKHKALLFCEVLFNNFCQKGILFNNFITLPHFYIKTFIPKRDHQTVIIQELVKHQVIDVDKSYNKVKHISKGYKFNYNLFNNLNYILYVAPSEIVDSNIISGDKNSTFLVNPLYDFTLKMLGNITITNETHEIINNFKLEKSKIILNNLINDDENYYLMIDGKKYEDIEFNVKYAKKVAKSMDTDLILFKNKMYISEVDEFIKNKELSNKVINKLKIFNLENNIYRVSRNDTNLRLDTNLTNFPKVLLDTLLFKGEKFTEVDISNSQFAFLCYITKDLDKDFIKYSQEGCLYQYLGDKLNITKAEAKQFMFEIAFGKVQKIHDNIRVIFPKTMKFIDNYKKENGYKMFSNLLQRKEATVMIDGLLNYLYIKGYDVLTVHDSIRTNKSMEKIIKKEMENYFKSIKFKCYLKDK